MRDYTHCRLPIELLLLLLLLLGIQTSYLALAAFNGNHLKLKGSVPSSTFLSSGTIRGGLLTPGHELTLISESLPLYLVLFIYYICILMDTCLNSRILSREPATGSKTRTKLTISDKKCVRC